MSNHWKIRIDELLSEIGIRASDDQIKKMNELLECSNKRYGIANTYESITNPFETENRKLKESHKKE